MVKKRCAENWCRKAKTALKDELSEPYFICSFLFSLFITYLLTLLLIGGRKIR